jgi:hypothetical protein
MNSIIKLINSIPILTFLFLKVVNNRHSDAVKELIRQFKIINLL